MSTIPVRSVIIALLVVLATLTTACGQESLRTIDDIALEWTEVGSCTLGDRSWCRTWTVYLDGKVESVRPEAGPVAGARDEGRVDADLAKRWYDEIRDLDDWRDLPKGPAEQRCGSVRDGVYWRATIPSLDVWIESCQFDFEADAPALDALRNLTTEIMTEFPTDASEFIPCGEVTNDGEC